MGDKSDVRRPRRAELAKFYGGEEGRDNKAAAAAAAAMGEEDEAASDDPHDINGAAFDAESFSQRLIRDSSLSQLMAQETEVVRQVGALDSDMQTLVYENYNKFIAATDTIRKMRVDFRAMEDEMDQLADKMHNISVFSAQIGDSLGDRRRRIGELSGTHALLKKLQFLFELPAKLKECIAEDDLGAGVRYYLRAQRVLDQYEHMASFAGIKSDCDAIMVELRKALLERLGDPTAAPEDLSLHVDLLLQLREPPEELCSAYLRTARVRLDESLGVMRAQVKLFSGDGVMDKDDKERPSDAYVAPMDILEFVDHGCNTFVSDLCLVIASYSDTFLQQEQHQQHKKKNKGERDSSPPSSSLVDQEMAEKKLVSFVEELNSTFFDALRERLRLEKKTEDTAIRVRALDRFHRRYGTNCECTLFDFPHLKLKE